MNISNINFNNTHINTPQISYKGNYLNSGISEDTVSINAKGNNTQPESFWNKLIAKIVNIKNKVLHSSDNSASKIQNGTYYNSVYEGFEEHFYTKTDTTVVPIELTQKQKQILTEKINTFENYKNNLSEEQLQELEKNKHGLLDFSVQDGMSDLELKGYKKFLNRYESFKNGDFSGITNEELAQLLYYTDTSDIISDGKIGSFAQGRVGSCWFLSMLGNYAATPEGEQNIAKRISAPDKDGNYTVTLNNPLNPNETETYVVSAEELKNYDLSDENSAFSSGDIDVRILEIAFDKMLYEYFKKDDNSSTPNIGTITPDIFKEFGNYPASYEQEIGASISEGLLEKNALVHKALGYKSNIINFYKNTDDEDTRQMLSKYIPREELDDNPNAIYMIETQLTSAENGNPAYTYNYKLCDEKALSQILNSEEYNSKDFTVGTGRSEYSENEKDQRYISTGHAYNLSKSDEESVTVIDPYNSAFPHAIGIDKFDDTFTRITYIPKN